MARQEPTAFFIYEEQVSVLLPRQQDGLTLARVELGERGPGGDRISNIAIHSAMWRTNLRTASGVPE